MAQANPPYLMQKLWFVTEFKHPDMNSLGEESYCLAQVVSAAEFLKSLETSLLAITPRDFEIGIARHGLTKRLIVMPKGGDRMSTRTKASNKCAFSIPSTASTKHT